jgi:hypothetical protein
MPIALGAAAYASLRVGPWKIEKRDRLVGLRDLARAESEKGETRLDFALRFGGKRPMVDEQDDPALQAVMKPEPADAAPVEDPPVAGPTRQGPPSDDTH